MNSGAENGAILGIPIEKAAFPVWKGRADI